MRTNDKFAEACANYAEARLQVKKATLRIGGNLSECNHPDLHSMSSKKGGQYTHVSQVLEWEVDDRGNASTYTNAERDEVLARCPACKEAWVAIQDRREWRKRFGTAKRLVTLYGNQVLADRIAPL